MRLHALLSGAGGKWAVLASLLLLLLFLLAESGRHLPGVPWLLPCEASVFQGADGMLVTTPLVLHSVGDIGLAIATLMHRADLMDQRAEQIQANLTHITQLLHNTTAQLNATREELASTADLLADAQQQLGLVSTFVQGAAKSIGLTATGALTLDGALATASAWIAGASSALGVNSTNGSVFGSGAGWLGQAGKVLGLNATGGVELDGRSPTGVVGDLQMQGVWISGASASLGLTGVGGVADDGSGWLGTTSAALGLGAAHPAAAAVAAAHDAACRIQAEAAAGAADPCKGDVKHAAAGKCAGAVQPYVGSQTLEEAGG